MRSNQNERLSALVSEAKKIAQDTHAVFAHLSGRQLNWKPGADQWSIAQCFDHLMTANGAYFPIFDKVLSGEKENTFWESLHVAACLLGKPAD